MLQCHTQKAQYQFIIQNKGKMNAKCQGEKQADKRALLANEHTGIPYIRKQTPLTDSSFLKLSGFTTKL